MKDWTDKVMETLAWLDCNHDKDVSPGFCPVCGAIVRLTDVITKDGRLTGSCGDAFTVSMWVE